MTREQIVARMIELSQDGLSATEIARQIGCGVTRNAVIGTLRRRGYRCQSIPVRVVRRVPRLHVVRLPQEKAPAALPSVVEREPARDGAGKLYTLATIGDGQCRWVQDEHLCANPVADRKTPYCEFHQAAAHSRRRAA